MTHMMKDTIKISKEMQSNDQGENVMETSFHKY